MKPEDGSAALLLRLPVVRSPKYLMFTHKVVGAQEALDLLQQGWPTKTVSVIHREAGFSPKNASHIVVHMSDVPRADMAFDSPSRFHVETILKHTSDLGPNDKLLVNCWLGMSRSTAAAIGIHIQHGLSPAEAFSTVVEARPIAMPNTLLLRHFDDHFNLHGELIDLVTEHNRQKLKRDFNTSVLSTPTQTEVSEMTRLLHLLKGY